MRKKTKQFNKRMHKNQKHDRKYVKHIKIY